MSDLIDRQAAIDAVLHHGEIENNYTDLYYDGYCDGVYDSADMLKDLPSAQPEPKTGRWKKTGAYPHKVYCSVCYATYVPNSELESWSMKKDSFWKLPRNYCPNCGAKMRGEQDG